MIVIARYIQTRERARPPILVFPSGTSRFQHEHKFFSRVNFGEESAAFRAKAIKIHLEK